MNFKFPPKYSLSRDLTRRARLDEDPEEEKNLQKQNNLTTKSPAYYPPVIFKTKGHQR